MKKFGLYLLVFLLSLTISSLWAANDGDEKIKKELAEDIEVEAEQRPQRGALLFLDESEKKFNGALSIALFSALEQKAGPILVSAALLNAFFKVAASLDEKVRANDPAVQNPFVQIVLQVKQALQQPVAVSEQTKFEFEISNKLEQSGILPQVRAIMGTRWPVDEIWQALLANRSFDIKEWMIFNVDNSQSLYLLIPDVYIKSIDSNFNMDQYQQQQYSRETLHDLALLLGFNLDTMEFIQSRHAQERVRKSWKRFPQPGYIITLLDKILVSRTDYFKNKKSMMIPAWTLYLYGHGGARRSVAGIPLADFARMLDFFEGKITTKLFVYNSCYAAGENAEQIYKDLQRAGSYKKIYSYPIITAALTDEMTGTWWPLMLNPPFFGLFGINWTNKNLSLNFDQDFSEFMQRALSATQPLDFATIITPIIPLIDEASGRGVKTAAQIKLPGLPWFSVLDAQNRVVSISSVMAATRGDKKMNIKSFYSQHRELAPREIEAKLQEKKSGIALSSRKASRRHRGKSFEDEPVAILLYTRDVPFELDISDMKSIPSFISMVPGRAIHYITRIDASNAPLSDLARHFENNPRIYKVFLIDTLLLDSFGSTSLNAQLLERPGQLTITDVLMKDGEVYFQHGSSVLVLKGDAFKEMSIAKPDEQKQYFQMLATYRNEIAERQGVRQAGSIISTSPQELSLLVGKLAELQKKHSERAKAKNDLKIIFQKNDHAQ